MIKNRKDKKNKVIFIIIGVIIIIFIIIFGRFILLVIAFTIKPEHIIERNNKKYVAYVSSFLDVDVSYYDYINPFFVGNIEKIHEYYGKGGYDPFDGMHNDCKVKSTRYYDDEGRKIKDDDDTENINKTDINNINTNQNIIKTQEKTNLLYYIEINNNVKFKVKNQGNRNGKNIIQIFKTIDGGKNWISQLKTADGTMDVNYDTQYTFINENLGFINDKNTRSMDGINSSLMITTDGGKHFNDVTIIPTNKIQGQLYCKDVPVWKNGRLELKVYTINNGTKTYYKFVNKGEAYFEFIYEE